jgi:Phage integrase family/N-terminal domain of anti-restriction factor ArdC
MPSASYVAGFNTWNKLGRFVKKGEKGILILAPIVRHKAQDEPEDSTAPASSIVGFRSAYVFDIAQTDGEDLPSIGTVQGDPSTYRERLFAFAQARGISVEYSPEIAPARGTSSGGCIRLLPGQMPAEEFSTSFTQKEMTTLLSKAEGPFLILYFFCAVTGMRVSEAIAIEIDKHVESDCSIIYVRQQREKHVNRVKKHLKIESGCRDVDLHPDAAAILRNYIGSRTTGFLFQTPRGTMFDPNNIVKESFGSILKEMGRDEVGTRFNAFRRFREAVLQRSEARQILIDYWMGHVSSSMGDRYGKQMVEDVEFRQQHVSKVGLGFELPPSLLGLRSGLQIAATVAA